MRHPAKTLPELALGGIAAVWGLTFVMVQDAIERLPTLAFLAAGYMFQTFGLERTSTSSAGFITGLFVVFTPVLGALVLGMRAAAIAWISV